MLAARLAQPEEREWRRKVVAELSRPDGAHSLSFSAGIDRALLDRTIFVMQTWVHDLLRLKNAAEPRHHVDCVPALKAKARRARLERLLALDRELLEARRLAAHPLNARLAAEHLMMAYNRATLA
jgi:DNA polymerase-3 subunit delta'